MTSLEKRIIARITEQGPITFRYLMAAALYDPDLGYNNPPRLKSGPAGDYYTSSNVHSSFGAVLAVALADMLSESTEDQSRRSATIVEMGAGTGRLACDIIATLRDEQRELFERLSYVIVETSHSMRELQKEMLNEFIDRISWRDLAEIGPQTGARIFFSNELVDAFPVHRARFSQGRIEESYVTTKPDLSLALVWGEPSTAELARYVERMNVKLSEGQIIEINLDGIGWLSRVAAAIECGYLVTIDYGDTVEHLYGPDRSAGTLRSFYKHRLSDSVLEKLGEQDMTASVNFTSLVEYGRDFGLETVSYERQTAFLMRRGLIERIAKMQSARGDIDDLKERLAIKNLFIPGGVSDNFRVLIQKKV